MAESVARGEPGGGATRLSIRLLGGGSCDVCHDATGARLRTSKPLAYGGSGDSFSSTDLLAAALGTCIATDLEPLIDRHGIRRDEVGIEVEKVLSTRPKRLEAVHVRVHLGGTVEDRTKLVIQRAAERCVVHRSLAPTIRVTVEVGPRRGARRDGGNRE